MNATLQEIKDILDTLGDSDLPDGAYWALAHEMAGLEFGEIFSIIDENLEFFGYKEVK